MKRAVWRIFCLLTLTCTPLFGHAADADRIAEILHHKTFSLNGQFLVSEMHASVTGCTIRLNLQKRDSCENGASFYSQTDYIDVRALLTDQEMVEFRDFSGTRFESLKGAVSYKYRSTYGRQLRFAEAQKSQILDEEYENFPTDVESRLTTLSERYRAEIDPASYSMSFEIVRFCSGVEIKSPLPSGRFRFYLDPSDMKQFANLIEGLSQSCEDG